MSRATPQMLVLPAVGANGVFLSLLPCWILARVVEVDFSCLLFVVGGLYGLVQCCEFVRLCVLRQSRAMRDFGTSASNSRYQFLQHPQLW